MELTYYVYLDVKNPGKIREIGTYRQQLLNQAVKHQPGNTALFDKILRTTYQTESIEKLILDINGSKGVKPNTTSKKTGIRFFAGLGLNATQLNFSAAYNGSLSGKNDIFSANKSAWSVLPILTGGVDFMLNKDVGTLLFRTEVNLTMNKLRTTFDQTTQNGLIPVPQREELTLDQLAASVNPQLLYNIFNGNKLKFYVAGGPQLTASSYSNQLYTIKYYYNDHYSGDVIASYGTKLTTQSILVNFTAKAGIVLINKLDMFIGYSSPTTVINGHQYTGNLTSYRLGMNYLFRSKK